MRYWWNRLRRSTRASQRNFALASRAAFRLCVRPLLALWAWGRARPWGYFAQGLPALAGLAIVFVFVVRWAALPAQELDARYQERATTAASNKDYSTALVCFERLALSGRDRPDNLYEMALALEANGRGERAFEIMEQLAPFDRTGYGPAHLWLAGYYWRSNLANPQNRTRAENHLVRSLETSLPDPDMAHALLGELYVRSSAWEKAEAQLRIAVKTRSHLRLRYALALKALGKKARADEEAQEAVIHFKKIAQADVRNAIARACWAEGLTFLGQFQEALEVLATGHHLAPDPAYPAAMAQVVLAWHEYVVKTAPEDVALQWTLLEKGLQLDSTNADLLNRLLSWMTGTKDKAAKVRGLINDAFAQGKVSATGHFLLGMDAWGQGKTAEAEAHWDRANQLSPNLPVVANNLAWLLAHKKQPDLPRALQLSNRVVEQYPQAPSFRDTRGRVYMKMGRWREALTDLELVLSRDPNTPGVHSALADTYAQLGMHELATVQRRLADESDKKKKAGKN